MSTARSSTVLVSLILNAGVSAEELSHASGIPLSAILAPTVIAYEDGMRLWHAAEALTSDPHVGLHCGMSISSDQISVLGSVFAHSQDLRAGLERIVSLLQLVIPGTDISFAERDGHGRIRYVSPGQHRHGVDAMFASILQLARDCTRHQVTPTRVDFQAPPPPSAAPYVAFFGVEPGWSRPASELSWRSSDLARPMRGAAPEASALLHERAEALLRPSGEPGVAATVAQAVRACIAAGDASAEAVAQQLGWSARTLQRKLRAAGTSLQSVRDGALHARASELLARPELSIEQIAATLGFSNRSSFERAYRRWTGSSPGRDRKTRR